MGERDEQDPVRWLDATEMADWIAINSMLVVLPAAIDVQLQRDSELSFFSYGVLARLSEVPEHTRRMSELANITHGSLSKLSHALTSLERRGWVERRPCPDDGRSIVVTLTDAGVAKLEASAPDHVETVRRLVLDPLTTDQRRALADAARRILAESDLPSPADTG